MSERSIYLRDQADKCETHARALTDVFTKEALGKLAAEYLVEAAKIEREEKQ